MTTTMKGKTYCKEENPLNTGYYAQPNNNFLHESLKGSKFFDRTNPIQLYPPQTMNLVGSIAFRERRGKFKWKEIMKLDLDQLVRNNDLTPLNDYLQDLIYASIDENDMQVIPEATFVKLVKMYQYILEYLMQTQQMFENENSSLQNSYNQLINDAMLKEKALKENKNMIRSLKKDKKEKEMILMTYKCILEEQKKSPNLNETDRDTSNIRYYCRICSGKKFSTEENLEAHMAKRHMHEFKNTPMRESTTTFDKKLEEMRTYFESYLKTYQGESFIKLYENQKNLESKLQEIKYEKTQELNDLEKNFRSTLMEMKEFYLKNSIMASTTTTTPITATTIGGTYAPPKNDQAEFISVFKEQVQVMNNALVDINNKNNEKISKILEQMSTFESTVAEEIKEIKDKKDKKKKEKKSEKEKEKEKLEDEELEKERKEKEKLKLEKEKLEKEKEKLEKEKLEREKQEIELRTSRRSKHIEEPKSKFIPSMTHVNSIEFTNEKKPVYIKDTTLNTSITNTKVHFNAGPLESDNDMEQVEENLKNKKSIHVSMRNINESIIRNESLAVEQQKFSFAPDASVKASMELSPFERPNEKEVSTTPLAPENQANLTVTPVESKPDIITHEIEEKPLSGIKSKQRGEFREENKEDKEKVKKQAREQLENFYYRFEDRDNETYESKKVNDYFKDTLPKEFNPVNEQLTKNLNELLDKGSLDTSKNRTKFSEIPNGSKDEVLDLINSVMNNIKRLSKDRDWFQSYYSTVSGTIGIGNYTHYALEKMGKTSSIITTAAKAGNSSNKNEMFNKINAQIEEFELNPNTEANEVKPLQATTNKELAKAVTLGERHSHRNNFNNVEDVDIVIDDQFDQVNH